MWELGLVAFGAVLGAVLTFVTSYWLDRRQRKEAEQDWHRDNQKEIDREAEDFVIEVQAFTFNPMVDIVHHGKDPRSFRDTTSSHTVFNRPRAIELIARANAFEARVADPDLKEHIRSLNTELLVANNNRSVGKDNLATIFAHCQKFYYRMAKLYGGPAPKTAEEQPPRLEYRSAPGRLVASESKEGEKAAEPPTKTVKSEQGPQAITEHTGQQAGVSSESEE